MKMVSMILKGSTAVVTAMIALLAVGSVPVARGQAAADSCTELGTLKDTGQDASSALTRCIDERTGSLELEPGIYTIAKEVVVSKAISISTRGVERNAGQCGSGVRACAVLFRSPEFVGSRPSPTNGTIAVPGGGALLRLTGAKVSLHHLEMNGIKNVLAGSPVKDSLIAITNCRDCRVESLFLKDGVGTTAMMVERSEKVLVTKSLFQDNGSPTALTSAIDVRSSSGVDIVANFFKNSSKFDINVRECKNCEIARNVMWHTKESRIAAMAALRIAGASVSVHDNFADCDIFGCNAAFVFGITANKGNKGAEGASISAFNNVASHAFNGYQFGLRSNIELVDNFTLGGTGKVQCSTTKNYPYSKRPGASITINGSAPKVSEIVEVDVSAKALTQLERQSCRVLANDTSSGTPVLSGRESFLINAVTLAFKNVLGRRPSADERRGASLLLANGTSLSDLITGMEALTGDEGKKEGARVSLRNGAQSAPGSQRSTQALSSASSKTASLSVAQASASATVPPPVIVSLLADSTSRKFDLSIGGLPASGMRRSYSVVYRDSLPAVLGAGLFTGESWQRLGYNEDSIVTRLPNLPSRLCAAVRVANWRESYWSAPVYKGACLPPQRPTTVSLATNPREGTFALSVDSSPAANIARQYSVVYRDSLPNGCTSEACSDSMVRTLFTNNTPRLTLSASQNSITLRSPTSFSTLRPGCAFIAVRHVVGPWPAQNGFIYSSSDPVYKWACLPPLSPTVSLATGRTRGTFALSVGSSPAASNIARQYSVVYRDSLPNGCTSEACSDSMVSTLFTNNTPRLTLSASQNSITLSSPPSFSPFRAVCAFIAVRYSVGSQPAQKGVPVYRWSCGGSPHVKIEDVTPDRNRLSRASRYFTFRLVFDQAVNLGSDQDWSFGEEIESRIKSKLLVTNGELTAVWKVCPASGKCRNDMVELDVTANTVGTVTVKLQNDAVTGANWIFGNTESPTVEATAHWTPVTITEITAPNGTYSRGDTLSITFKFSRSGHGYPWVKKLKLLCGDGTESEEHSWGNSVRFQGNQLVVDIWPRNCISNDLQIVSLDVSFPRSAFDRTAFGDHPVDLTLPAPGSTGSLDQTSNIILTDLPPPSPTVSP